jgi:hypothetical protein
LELQLHQERDRLQREHTEQVSRLDRERQLALSAKDREIEELRREIEEMKRGQHDRDMVDGGENNNNQGEEYYPPRSNNQHDNHSGTRESQMIGSPQKTNSTIVVVSAEQA